MTGRAEEHELSELSELSDQELAEAVQLLSGGSSGQEQDLSAALKRQSEGVERELGAAVQDVLQERLPTHTTQHNTARTAGEAAQ